MTSTQKLQQIKSQISVQNRRGSTDMATKQTDVIQMLVDEMRSFKAEIRQELQDNRKELNENLNTGLEKFEKKLDSVANEFIVLKKDVNLLKTKTTTLEEEMKHISEKQRAEENLVLLQELRYRERCLKLRGVPEVAQENIFKIIVKHIADFIGVTEAELEYDVDKIFRVSSTLAKEKHLPRDIVLCLTRTKIREEILQKSYTEKLIIDDKPIGIFKDIPMTILKRRQEYRNLIQLLSKHNINYAWDRLEGVSFMYRQRRYKINTKEKAENFCKKLQKQDQERKGNIETRSQTRHKEAGLSKEEEDRINRQREEVLKKTEIELENSSDTGDNTGLGLS